MPYLARLARWWSATVGATESRTYHLRGVRRFFLTLLLSVFVAAPVSALAQSDGGRLDVIDVSGPLDDQAVAFMRDALAETTRLGSDAVVIQLDSPGVIADGAAFEALLAEVRNPSVPLIVWVGPAPAVAYGGAVDLLLAAPLKAAAPGARIGLAEPTLVADTEDTTTAVPLPLTESFLVVEEVVPGVVDVVSPAIRQLLQGLDGQTVPVGGQPVQLSTLTTTEVEGETITSLVETVFHKPGYWARFLRLAVTPEAAFLFLVAGLTVAAFEFYAIGPGVAAGVASISLFLASYGIHALPVRWWALLLTLAGWGLLTISYQRGGVMTLTGAGSISILAGGLWYVDGAPQIEMNPIVTIVIALTVLLFYTVAMPTVARARFSTRTIGREHLIGEEGVALVDFDPDGEVEVAGARWKATGHREAGIRRGATVRIAEVDGQVLEVEPVTAAD